MVNEDSEAKGGIYRGKARNVDVSGISAQRLAEIQAEVGEHGIDLNVNVGTGEAEPTITAIIPKGKKLPSEKPL